MKGATGKTKAFQKQVLQMLTNNPTMQYRAIERELGLHEDWIANQKFKYPNFKRQIEELYDRIANEAFEKAQASLFELMSDGYTPTERMKAIDLLYKTHNKYTNKQEVSGSIGVEIITIEGEESLED